MAHGSMVTNISQPVRRWFLSRAAASRKATISACAEGSWSRIVRLCPRPTISPSSITKAPTGTSPALRASAASSRAIRIQAASPLTFLVFQAWIKSSCRTEILREQQLCILLYDRPTRQCLPLSKHILASNRLLAKFGEANNRPTGQFIFRRRTHEQKTFDGICAGQWHGLGANQRRQCGQYKHRPEPARHADTDTA